jgi:hypothetical protein
MIDYVLSHLPEMEQPQLDVIGLNRRAKNPERYRERVFRLVPIAAAVLLVILAAVINTRWPRDTIPPRALGMVAYTAGNVLQGEVDSTRMAPTSPKTAALPGDRFATGADSRASLLLLGPSEVRMDADTSLRVTSDRQITLDHGRIYLDIAKSRRWFKVFTPKGEVTVFGTRFEVKADSARTTVTVAEGEVQLTLRDAQQVFRTIGPNQSAYVEDGFDSVKWSTTDANAIMAWAEGIAAREPVRQYFMARIQPAYEITEVPAEPAYVFGGAGELLSFTISWEGTDPLVRYCDYELFVTTANNEPYFSHHIDGSVFSDPLRTDYEIENTANRRTSAQTFSAKLVPVLDSDQPVRRVDSLSVSANFLTTTRKGGF